MKDARKQDRGVIYELEFYDRKQSMEETMMDRKGEYFIPRQVGLPERRFDRYDPAVDHCWFELDEDCFSETVEPPTVALTATELVNRFEGCKNNWRDEAYTPQMGGMKF